MSRKYHVQSLAQLDEADLDLLQWGLHLNRFEQELL